MKVHPALYWINLPSRVDRADRMLAQLPPQSAYPSERVPAYCPLDLPDLLAPGALEAGLRAGRSPCELACVASHLEALRRAAADTDSGWALVCEDDVELGGRAYDPAKVAAASPPGSEVLQLTCMNAGAVEARWNPNRADMWRPWRTFMSGMQLYAVDRRAVAARLAAAFPALDLKRPLLGQRALDPAAAARALGCHAVSDELVFLMMRGAVSSRVPFCGGDASMGSDIHEDHLPQHAAWWSAIARRLAEPEVAAFLDSFKAP